MTQKAFNHNDNINVPHGISFWFDEGWTGVFKEVGDCVIDGVSISPEFQDVWSYRNGQRAIRKRLLSSRTASVSMTLNEPNIVNLKRALFGGTISAGQSLTLFEGKILEIDSDGGGIFVDFVDAGETDFAHISLTGVYAEDDYDETTNLLATATASDTDGKVYLDQTDTGLSDGDTVRIRYTITVTTLTRSEIFGATNSTIEGAARLQARNQQGGVFQVWDLSSVHLAPNGDLPYAMDAIQTIPLLATLQERSGTFGYIYCK